MICLRHWDDLPAELVGTDVVRRRLEGDGAVLVRVHIKAGTKADRHAHGHEQFVQVLSGSGVLHTEEGSRPFKAGCLFHFPPETWHAAEFESDSVLVETNFKKPG